ncbi:MAG: UDP-3-O-[3-hydroxymyristoyl] N-acetylglucosamine deacetylase [Verrucomicrobia bacterium]|nr:UDP-3-O-[3-hydroxymyristoyl] N-acetylglucosamine deacetylase [Verrucomicrobiota bacterium]
MLKQQQTLKKAASFSGIGLHTGNAVTMTLKPAAAGSGIRFKRMDLDGQPEVEALIENVVDTTRGTTLGKGNLRVHTVEHIMSALSGCGVDNVGVELNANEPPVGDGSSRPYVQMIHEAGMAAQDAQREPAQPSQPIWVSSGDSMMVVLPSDRLRVSCTIAFQADGIEAQYLSVAIDRETYEEQIAPCRTFCPYRDCEQLLKAGLLKGGSLETGNIIQGGAVLTNGGLRFADEFVRHKILDVIGDLALIGRPLAAHVIAVKPGHTANCDLARQLGRALAKPAPQPAAGGPAVAAVTGAAAVDVYGLLKTLPHRYPFMLVDRVIHVDADHITAIKNVTINEPYFQGHFPGHPVMPGVLQVEAMAQAAGILMLRRDGNFGKLAYFMSADKVKFRKPVVPGDQLIIEAELTRARKTIGRAKCVCKVGDDIVSEAELMFLVND